MGTHRMAAALWAFGLGAVLIYGAVTLAAETTTIAPGEIVDFEAKNPRRVAVRLANLGDSSLGIVTRDSLRQVSINAVLEPGEVRDFLTPSAEIATATVNARLEGNVGGVLEVLPLETDVEIRVPRVGDGFPCDEIVRPIYQSDDGASAPEVSYLIRNERGADCQIQVTILRPGSVIPELTTITGGDSQEFTGVFREISVSGRGNDNDRVVYFYTKLK